MNIRLASATDVGRKRAHNEDSLAIVPASDARPSQRLLVLSDGMGGAQAGEVASRLTVDVVVGVFGEDGTNDPGDDLRRAVVEANRVVHEKSQAEPELHGMGATCTALVVQDAEAWVAHVGDSRAYMIRNGRIRQITQDHSLVAQLVQQHQLTPEQAKEDHRRNVVTRSIGIAPTVEVDLQKLDLELEPGDTLLLCSDGLHGQVSDEEIARLGGGDDVERAAVELIALANERGGPDNISVILGRLEPERSGGPPPESPRATSSAAPRRSTGRTLLLLTLALLALAGALLVGYWVVQRMLAQGDKLALAQSVTASGTT